jgi:integrase
MTKTAALPLPPRGNALEQTSYLDLSPGQSRVLENLKEFLKHHDSRVGRVLLGLEGGRWAAKDMRGLESMMLKNIDDPKALSRMLRVLRKVVAGWAMRHVQAVAFPRIPVLPHYARNPISPDLARLLSRYQEWKKWLDQWLEENGAENPDRYHPIATPVPAIVSAVLYGGLCSIACVVALVRAMNNVLANSSASKQRFYLDLHLSLPRTSDTEYRAWQPDPISTCLFLRTDPSAVCNLLAPPDSTLPDFGPSDGIITGRLRELFKETLVKHPRINSGVSMGSIHGLIEAAQTVAYLELPPIVACYAGRGLVSHSVPMPVIRRTTHQDWYENPFQAPRIAPRAFEQPHKKQPVSEQFAEFPPDWLEPLRLKMRSTNLKEFAIGVNSLKNDLTQSPLVRRLADFAQALLTQRNRSNKLRPLSVIRRTVREAAMGIGPFLADESDPVDLSCEGLEHLYELALANRTGSESTASGRNRAKGALRDFDAYLKVCYGKSAREDSLLGGPVEILGAVDANFITPTEYNKVLDRIDRDISLRQNPARLRIVRLLVNLGHRAGLRRLEALHIKIRDVLLEKVGTDLLGPAELLVRPSESHRLKSNNAKRRLPLEILLSPNELGELKEWYADRTSQSGVKTSDYLFGNVDGIDDFDVLPQTVFKTINGFLQEVTNTRDTAKPVHFHHLRHGFCTLGLLRFLTSPEMTDIPDCLPGCEGLMEWLQSDEVFAPAKLYRQHLPLPTRKLAYLMSGLMGHGSPATSMTYTHCLSWLLPALLAQSATMHPKEKTFAMATGVSAKSKERWAKRANGAPVWGHLWDWRARNHTPPAGSMIGKAADKMLRSPDSTNWIEPIERFLHEMDFPGQSVAGAANLCGVDEASAEEWRGRADYLRNKLKSRTGDPRHRFELAKNHISSADEGIFGHCPVKPLHATELEIVSRYAPILQQLGANASTRNLLEAGLSVYVHAVWSTKNFALFHDPDTDGPRARQFLDLLLALKLQLRHVSFLRFKHQPKMGWSGRWRESLGQSKYVTFEICNPPNKDSDGCASWLALQPRFCFEEDPLVLGPGLAGFRYLMTLGYIAFGALPQTHKDKPRGTSSD